MADQTQLAAIAKIVNDHEDFWAELGDDHYLLRFNTTAEDGNNLVLMYDLGVTWEPYRAYPTPRYCIIDITDAETAAQNLMKLAKAELPMQCDDDSYQHLVD